MYKIPKLLILVLSGLLIFTSCDSGTVYDQQVVLPQDGWFMNEAVKFDVDIVDTLLPYDFNLTLRHTTDYRYSNLYVFMTTQFPNGKISRDTIECLLADVSGRWMGSGWGKVRDEEINLRTQLHFPQRGQYQFYIQQAMRTDTLKEITHVGLRLVVSDEYE
jgi:gliding motility-associated lipoprotein GldH